MMNLKCNQSGVSVSHLRPSENAPKSPSVLVLKQAMQQESPKAHCQEKRQECGILVIDIQIRLTLHK